MSDIERILIEGNLRFHLKITQELENIEPKSKLPRYPLLILTCMDPRIDIHRIFQLNPGDVFVLRNAGNLCTQDSLRSILLAIYQYEIKHIIVLGHLDCGMTKINLLELKKKVPHEHIPYKSEISTDLFLETKEFFKPFIDELINIKVQMETLSKLQVHKPELQILGMLYDIETGWVFEYDRFKDCSSTENFKEQFEIKLRKKQVQFIDFLEKTKDKRMKVEKLDKLKQDKELNEAREKYISDVLNKRDKIPIDSKDQTLNIPTILTKIQVPKINFPGVKIHIPKIYRKRKNIKNET